MADRPYQVAGLDEIETIVEPEFGSYEWKPVRRHFGVRSFGVNASIAPAAGDWVVEEHTETVESGTRHEELFFVARGHATFVIEGEEVDAPAGTFVFVRDPATRRGARALESGTTVLAVGAEPGVAFEVSPWEAKYAK